LIELNPESLLTILPAETVKKIWKFARGSRIYFPDKRLERIEILEDYEKLRVDGVSKIDSIRILSYKYEKSENRIKEIITKK